LLEIAFKIVIIIIREKLF